VVDDRLAPGATPDDVREVAAEHGAGAVVVVGHQPDCGRAAAALGDGVEPAFPPCGYHTVDV
jgi:phosphohistidine phosphatase SixA